MDLTESSELQAAPPKTLLRRVLAVLKMTHLFPTVMVLTATVIFGFVASRGQVDWGLFVRVWLVVLCGHSSIGIANDYLDRERDAIAQPYKPIPGGLVSANFAVGLLVGLLLTGAVIALTLPLAATLLAVVCTASGLLYNFFLKDSYLSWVPYLLSFSSFPIFVWAGLDKFQADLLWLYPPALFLVIGINLANSLPDIDTDLKEHGSRGLGHLLGTRRALVALWVLFGAAPLLCLGLSFFIPVNRLLAWPACALALLLVAASLVAPRLRPGRPGLTLVWQLTTLATFFVAIGWLGALTLK
jgi:4-hydroxybenzoate polyprenyltransferase